MNVIVDTWDELEEQLATLVIQRNMPLNTAIMFVCREHVGYPVKAMLLATISFVTHIESTDGGKRKSRQNLSLQRHKTALALAADVSALNDHRNTCGDLIDFWEVSCDGFFSS
ncbi:hypothetical protein [Flavimaricola marinus]|uniref:hypothetical protein n=1 Tax=Flavimaricola marinus TaxID=1819565 RepID=UPI000B8A80BD|nr:hypothetical protein [Flavimaricola marinus]